MNPITLHEAAKSALAYHWENCPHRCTINHIKCRMGRQLIAVEEAAWLAARLEKLGTNASMVADPQSEPHEPCCPAGVPS